MKLSLNRIVAVAALIVSPTVAASNFFVDFEKTWDFSDGSVNGYYGGGTASDGTSGPNLGVTFSGVSGLSNDALGPYYANAPTMQGVAYAYGPAFMNVFAGVAKELSFYYSSPEVVTGAVKAYSGLNGTGTLLGVFDIMANSIGAYDTWTLATLNFTGIASSFDFSASANIVDFDNISGAPEPNMYALLLAGLGVLGLMARRRKQETADN